MTVTSASGNELGQTSKHVVGRHLLLQDITSMTRDFFRSSQRNITLSLFAALTVVLIVNMFGQAALNNWQGAFYRTIEQRRFAEIPAGLSLALAIFSLLLAIVVAQSWLTERLKISMRRWLFRSLLEAWSAPGCAYRINSESRGPLNPDQRLQEDTRLFSEATADLGNGFLQSLTLFITFVGVLWRLSRGVHLRYGELDLMIPGYLVWAAIGYALVSFSLSAWAGRPLIGLNARRFSEEAKLRFGVMRMNESAESIAFYRGEDEEKQQMAENFRFLTSTQGRLATALARVTWFTSGTAWIFLVFPLLVGLPGYAQGVFDLGTLMIVVGAFNQVQSSLRWGVDNVPRFAEWRATLRRICEFRAAIRRDEELRSASANVERLTSDRNELRLENVTLATADRRKLVSEVSATIAAGERVLLSGASGTGKSSLLRALAGLWRHGQGRIHLPRDGSFMFLPQKPYLPLGSLRAALEYPGRALHFSDSDMAWTLERVNLAELIPSLDLVERWDQILSLGQQQRLAFARLMLHRPGWVFLDEATSALDEVNQHHLMSLFRDDLRDCAVISVGHRPGLEAYHTRRLSLLKSDNGSVLSDEKIAHLYPILVGNPLEAVKESPPAVPTSTAPSIERVF